MNIYGYGFANLGTVLFGYELAIATVSRSHKFNNQYMEINYNNCFIKVSKLLLLNPI